MQWGAGQFTPPYPAGAALHYTPATRPTEWIQTLGASLSLFLADKQVIPAGHIPPAATWLDRGAENAVTTESASIAWLTAADRARRLGLIASAPAVQLAGSPLVEATQQTLG